MHNLWGDEQVRPGQNFWQLRRHNSCARALSFLELLHQSGTPALNSCQTDPTVSSFLPLPCPPTAIRMPRAVPVVPLLTTEGDARRLGRSATASRFRLNRKMPIKTDAHYYVQNQRTRRNKDVERKNEPQRDDAPRRTETGSVRTWNKKRDQFSL